MRNKYIVFENDMGIDIIVVFPEFLKHNEIAVPGPVVSAGFIAKNPDSKFVCFGRSTSLDLNSRLRDSELANKQLFYEAA